LDKGSIRAFLDSRGVELDGALAAARRDVAAGDDPAAKADMARVADLLEEMAGGVEEAQKRGGSGDDSLKKDIEALQSELGSLAADEAALQKKTDAARDRHGQSLEKGLAAWKAVDAAAEAARRAMADPALNVDKSARPFTSAAEDAQHDAAGLGDSVRARDTQTSLERAEDLRQSVERARSRLQQAVRAKQVSGAEAARADAALERAGRAADEAAGKLEELAAAQQGASPELAAALKELAGDQQALAERAAKTGERAKRVAQQLPADGEELQQATDEGVEQAKRATEALQEGDAMGASGGQLAAEDAFERAQEALQQALQDAQEMQKAREGGGGGMRQKVKQ
jgi:hypothetical protein